MSFVFNQVFNFLKVFRNERPRNLLLLPSFPSPVLEADGVHLTPFSGLQFVTHLLEASTEQIANLKKSASSMITIQSESIRSLEDRVLVVEQDHRRLNRSVENKSAISSESADFAENQRLFALIRF